MHVLYIHACTCVHVRVYMYMYMCVLDLVLLSGIVELVCNLSIESYAKIVVHTRHFPSLPQYAVDKDIRIAG